MFYLDKLDTDRLEKIRDSVILDRKCSPVTANRYLAALSATLHYAHKKKKLAGRLPARRVIRPGTRR